MTLLHLDKAVSRVGMLLVMKASVLHRPSVSSMFFCSLYTCLPLLVQVGRGVAGGGVDGDSSETPASFTS